MKRQLATDELRLWAAVAKTVRPGHGRALPVAPPIETPPARSPKARAAKLGSISALSATADPTVPAPLRAAFRPSAPAAAGASEHIEPGRLRRIQRERDPIDARIDLHGLDQFAAEDQLKAFLFRARDAGLRAVLVITGKGSRGDGVIRRRLSDWLADPALRHVVAGVAMAHRRHGGEGAVYIAIKRRSGP